MFTGIIDDLGAAVQRESLSACRVGLFERGVVTSLAFESRIRAHRRSVYILGEVRLAPREDLASVESSRPCLTSRKHQTNDCECDCPAGVYYRDRVCVHRNALLLAGGVDGYYRWVGVQLGNPALLECYLCGSLLDGNEYPLGEGVCLACVLEGKGKGD